MKRLVLVIFLLVSALSFSSKHHHIEHSWDDVEIEGLELPWEDIELEDLNPWDDIEIDDLDLVDDIKFKKNQIKVKGIEIGDDNLDIKLKRKHHHWKHKDRYEDDDDDYEEDDD